MVDHDDSFDDLLRSVAHAPAVSIAELDLAGRRLGRFRVRSRLGSGGMGVVYEAWDERLSRVVALKVLRATHMRSDGHRVRLHDEARRAAAVSHPNIATVFDVDEHDGITFIALELVAGEPLRALLDRGGLPIERTLEILRDVASGLSCAHRAGIVHRDLKPDNVMISGTGGVKLLDFGLAILAGAGDSTTPSPQRVGTPGYMAPEQGGGAADARADVFSFGVLARDMLATATAGDARSPSARALRALAETCTSRDPAARPRDGEALAERLHALSPRAPRARARGAQPAFVAALAAATVAFAAIGIHTERDMRARPGAAQAPRSTERAVDERDATAMREVPRPTTASGRAAAQRGSGELAGDEPGLDPFVPEPRSAPVAVSDEDAVGELPVARAERPVDPSRRRGGLPSGLPVTLRVDRSGKVVATVDLGPLRGRARTLGLPAPNGESDGLEGIPEAEAEVYVEENEGGAVLRLAIRLDPGGRPASEPVDVARAGDTTGAPGPALDGGVTGTHLTAGGGVSVSAAALDGLGAETWNVVLCADALPEALSVRLDSKGRFVLEAVASDGARAFALVGADGEIAELGAGVSACAGDD